MLFKEIKQRLLQERDKSFRVSLRAKQLLILGGSTTVLLLAGGIYFASSSSNPESSPSKTPSQSEPKTVEKMTTPLQAVDERDIWVSRIEKKAEEVKEESETLRQENQFLQKRMDVLETLFKNHPSLPDKEDVSSQAENLIQTPHITPSQQAPSFPPQGSSIQEEATNAHQDHLDSSFSDSSHKKGKGRGPKIAHISGRAHGVSFKTKDLYMPAGTYSKAVVISGMAASTATNAQGNPQPMMLRLVDDGNLPRGFKGRVKDAVLIGSCYGDISSERAYCRLETLSWVEADGTTVEKKVEGWVFGEDGRAGLRGEVVDRSSDIARESFGAGLLSAAANFFKMESSRGVYPVSPFGQTGAMSNKDAMQGAAASGVGSALDRLAEFSIKRAEQMQPVILIASGRVVDIAFKEGVSLLAEDEAEMKRIGQGKDNNQAEGEEQ